MIPESTETTAIDMASSSEILARRASRTANQTPSAIPTAVNRPCQVSSNPPVSINTGLMLMLMIATSSGIVPPPVLRLSVVASKQSAAGTDPQLALLSNVAAGELLQF